MNGIAIIRTKLNKVSERDQTNWVKWLPFIELAYITRIHSTTKLTPYKLMYGIKCTGFET